MFQAFVNSAEDETRYYRGEAAVGRDAVVQFGNCLYKFIR